MNRAFEKFCRNHFIQRDGSVGDITASTSEAKTRKRELFINRLTRRKDKVNRQLNDHYRLMSKLRGDNPEDVYLQKVIPVMKEATVLREELNSLQKQIGRVLRRKRGKKNESKLSNRPAVRHIEGEQGQSNRG